MMDEKDLLEKIIAEEDEKNTSKPWERQDYETDRMFGAFRIYANLPTIERTLNVAYRSYIASTGKKPAKGTKASNTWRNWAFGTDNAGNPIPGAIPWALRARAEDAYKEEIIRRTQTERQALLRTREWELSEKLFDRVKQMISFPLARTETVTDKNGNPIQVIIEPANWKEEDIARTFATASKVARMSVEMPTTQVKFDWRKDVAGKGIDPESLINNVVNAIETAMELADTTAD